MSRSTLAAAALDLACEKCNGYLAASMLLAMSPERLAHEYVHMASRAQDAEAAAKLNAETIRKMQDARFDRMDVEDARFGGLSDKEVMNELNRLRSERTRLTKELEEMTKSRDLYHRIATTK